MSNQFHFEFKDWEAAFQEFYDKHVVTVLPPESPDDQIACIEGNREWCLIISKHPYTSGYWVERFPIINEQDAFTKTYRTLDQVVALHRRVIKARESTVNLSIGGLVT